MLSESQHERAIAALRHALVLRTPDAWLALAVVLEVRLSEADRAGLAYAALRTLPEDAAYRLASLAIFGVAAGGAVW